MTTLIPPAQLDLDRDRLIMRASPTYSLQWIAAYHRWRSRGCMTTWEHYRRSPNPAERKGCLPYRQEARASDELAGMVQRQIDRLASMEATRA